MTDLVFRTAAVEATHDLRRLVLREGRPDADVDYPEDELGETFHLLALDGDEVVATSTWAAVSTPLRPGRTAWRLRGMAVHPERQGTGVGARLIDAALARLREEGVEVVWADGRDTALAFYVRHGWSVEGDGFESAGLPHHNVVLDLTDPPPIEPA